MNFQAVDIKVLQAIELNQCFACCFTIDADETKFQGFLPWKTWQLFNFCVGVFVWDRLLSIAELSKNSIHGSRWEEVAWYTVCKDSIHDGLSVSICSHVLKTHF